jgi:hypothetical protein
MTTLVDSFVEVVLRDESYFLKVKETLTRIGVASRKEHTLYQSCHILHKKGKYYIVHFKELFALDGKPTDFNDEDKGRRNTIAALLEEWDLISVVNKDLIESPKSTLANIKIIPYKEKNLWKLIPKYNIGKGKKQ